jgi:hypothetical protein
MRTVPTGASGAKPCPRSPSGPPRDLSSFALLVLGVLFVSACPDGGPPLAASPPLAPGEAVAVVALTAALVALAAACVALVQGRAVVRRLDALVHALDAPLQRLAPPPPCAPSLPSPPPVARPPSEPSSASEPTLYMDPANVGDHCGGEGCDPALGTCSCSCSGCRPAAPRGTP